MTLAIALCTPAAARADAITLVQDGRRANVLADSGDAATRQVVSDQRGDVLTSTAAASGPTGSGTATAGLTSSFGDLSHWAGSGAVDVSFMSSDVGEYNSTSAFGAIFAVTSPLSYTFTQSFTASSSLDPATNPGSFANAVALLQGENGFLFNVVSPFTFFPQSLTGNRAFSGVLLRGTYTFTAGASAGGFARHNTVTGAADARFAFTLDFSPAGGPAPTPEPASLLLLGTGVVSTFWFRMRSTRA